MTSVTRSRECPRCGKSIIMQTAARDSRQPRKALLMPGAGAAAGADTTVSAATETLPRPLSGDPRERMQLDPEVRRTAARLKWGLAFFGGLLLGVLLWHYFHLSALISQPLGQTGLVSTRTPPSDLFDSTPTAPVFSTPAPEPKGNASLKSETVPSPIPESTPGPELTDQQQALKGVFSFLDATTVEERLTRVRDREFNEERIRRYYSRVGDRAIAHERVEALEINPAGPFTYSFNVVLPDGARRAIVMGKSQSDEYLADWASFVVYSEMSRSDFRAQRPRTATMFRVLADREKMFGHEFNDPEAFLCVRLLDPLDSAATPVYGYVTKSSSIGRALSFVMEKSQGQPIPLMMRLSYPENSVTDNQVWVTEFIGEGWIARNW